MYLEKEIERIKLAGLSCEGSSIDEIIQQEQILNTAFPAAYKAFLAICGKKQNHFFCGSDVALTQ